MATTRVATLGTHCHWVPTHTNTRKHHALGLARLCDAGTLGDCVVCDGVCARAASVCAWSLTLRRSVLSQLSRASFVKIAVHTVGLFSNKLLLPKCANYYARRFHLCVCSLLNLNTLKGGTNTQLTRGSGASPSGPRTCGCVRVPAAYDECVRRSWREDRVSLPPS